MKLLTSAEQLLSLSPAARQKLNLWLQQKEYGMTLEDGKFFPLTQLSIGQMIEFLWEQEWAQWNYLADLVMPYAWCDYLWESCVEILEQKN